MQNCVARLILNNLISSKAKISQKLQFLKGPKKTSKRPRRSNLMCSDPPKVAILSNFALHKQSSISKDNKVRGRSILDF